MYSLSGSVCVFTGLLSVAFLGRTILAYMWIGIGTLMLGLVLIGLADAVFLGVDEDVNGIISGKCYCAIAIYYIFKPPPPVGAGGGCMFSGRPSVPLSVRPSVRP